jgi:FG-GAP-like repeat/Fibronectin type III domain
MATSLLSSVRMQRCLICFWSFCVAGLALGGVANAATLKLAWNPNTDPNLGGYVLYWGTQSGVYTSNSNVGNVTTTQVTGLADGTVYYFAVEAYNTAGLMSGYSNEVSGQTSGGTPPAYGGASPINCANTPTAPGCVAGTDFNGDGHPDVIWQNESTWQVVVWYMGGSQGAVPQGWTWLSGAGVPGWRIVAARDFDSDGKPDLVWQNESTRQVTVWYMGGSQANVPQRWAWLSQAGVPGWRVVAARDFNADGKPDLVWQHDTTRQVSIWYLGGAQGDTPLGSNSVSSFGVAGWRVVGTADFDGDGSNDLVWQEDATRRVVVWHMGGSQGNLSLALTWLSSAGVPGWSVVGTSEFNRDGKPDLVWQNDATRQLIGWFMGGAQGNTLLSWSWLSSVGQPGWRAIVR